MNSPRIEDESLVRLAGSHGSAGASLKEFERSLGVRRSERPALRRQLAVLVASGRVIRTARGKYGVPAREIPGVTGRITLHPDGYGFVRADDGGPDVFIPVRATARARTGDVVTASVDRVGAGGRRSGSVRSIDDPRGAEIIGRIEPGARGFARLIPLDRSAGGPVSIRTPETVAEGTVVVARLQGDERRAGGRRGELERVLGGADDPGTAERIAIAKYGLAESHTQAVLADAARQADAALARLPGEKREDFRGWVTVTIDGETAKDFDDAVSIKALPGGGTRLAVHIADVAAFVPEDSAVDRAARERGTSVYFPGRVLPMLPPLLSDDLCSLRPQTDRAVQSVILDFDRAGRRISHRFSDGWIRSAARLTYGEVAGWLARANPPRLPKEIGESLTMMGALASRIGAVRRARGSLDFDLPEPQILLDVDGMAQSVVAGERNDAHRLIEEFMLAANEAVADTLAERMAAAMYRVHDRPDATKMQALAEAIEGLGYRLPAGAEPIEPGDLARVVERSEGRPEERFVQTIVLRSLMQARYSETVAPHFGLAAERYTHFTSPIRRYPDLVAHRLLRSLRGGGPAKPAPGAEELARLARACSRLERDAESAEREVLERRILSLMKSRIGETRPGHVTGVTPFGLFVHLEGLFLEGLVPIESLPGGPWTHDPRQHRLLSRARGGGPVIRLGDPMTVTIARIDPVFRRVELLPEDTGGRSAPQARTKKPRTRAPRGAAPKKKQRNRR